MYSIYKIAANGRYRSGKTYKRGTHNIKNPTIAILIFLAPQQVANPHIIAGMVNI
jgi:hypothetical protein